MVLDFNLGLFHETILLGRNGAGTIKVKWNLAEAIITFGKVRPGKGDHARVIRGEATEPATPAPVKIR